VDFVSISREKRPLTHGITAAFGLSFYAERDEAVKSGDNGCVWILSPYRTKRSC